MLKIRDVDAFYGDIRILHRVSLDVDEGEIVSLIGGNGAGKTTLLNVISGLHPTPNGSRTFLGSTIRGLKPEKIAALGLIHAPETEKIFAPLTICENLELGAYLKRRSRASLLGDMEKVFELFPALKERNGQPAGALSGGERQMLALGRALMGHPRLLMLDEPSLGLAPTIVSEIFRIIRSLNEQGTTLLLVEQNAREALRMSHRAYVLDAGRIILSGSGEELLVNEEVRSAFLGGDPREQREGYRFRIQRPEARIQEVLS